MKFDLEEVNTIYDFAGREFCKVCWLFIALKSYSESKQGAGKDSKQSNNSTVEILDNNICGEGSTTIYDGLPESLVIQLVLVFYLFEISSDSCSGLIEIEFVILIRSS